MFENLADRVSGADIDLDEGTLDGTPIREVPDEEAHGRHVVYESEYGGGVRSIDSRLLDYMGFETRNFIDGEIFANVLAEEAR